MSSFVNLSKSFVDYIAKALAPKTISASNGVNAKLENTIISRWSNRNIFRRKRISSMLSKAWSSFQKANFEQNSLPSVERQRAFPRIRSNHAAGVLTNLSSGFSRRKAFSMPHQHQIVRTKCGRENCADPCYWPPCPPFSKRVPNTQNPLFNIYEAYWDDKNDDCCDDPCDWALMHPRFDDMYLAESDKAERTYTRTWTECLPRMKPKRVCSFDGVPPDFCRRPKAIRPKTAACPASTETDPEADCDESSKCKKIKMPCCCEVGKYTNCKPKPRGPMKCKRFYTPYPSFSECQRPRARPARRVECSCLNTVTKCEVYAYWRNRILSRLGPC